MLKNSVAKYYIWATAAAYFVVILQVFIPLRIPGRDTSQCEVWDATPKTDFKKRMNYNARSQVLGVLWALQAGEKELLSS